MPGETAAHRRAPRALRAPASPPASATTRRCRATTGNRRPGADGSPGSGSTRPCCSRTTACSGSAQLVRSLPALLANMGAWNRWCAIGRRRRRRPAAPGRAPEPARPRLARAPARARSRRAGVRLAMIAPALVDGRPLSHPDLDRAWAVVRRARRHAVFHVADQPRPFDDAWYTDGRRRVRAGARVGVPLHRRRAGVHRPDRERRVRAPSRPAPRHRRAVGGLGADVPDDARRRRRLHHAAQRVGHRPS